MPDEPIRHIEEESSYPEVKLPDLKSDIPVHLLTDASPESKYILEQLSVLSQYAKWSAPVLVETNQQTRKTNGRLLRVEAWKGMFTSWWALLMALVALVGGVAGVIEAIRFFTGS
jgi:hypothetical protein